MSNEPIQADEAGNVTSFGEETDAHFLRVMASKLSLSGNPVEAHRMFQIADSLDCMGAAAALSATIQKAFEFFRGLDANDKERLAAVPISGFDEFVTSMPGPDFFDSTAKATARPHVIVAINNGVNALCGGA